MVGGPKLANGTKSHATGAEGEEREAVSAEAGVYTHRAATTAARPPARKRPASSSGSKSKEKGASPKKTNARHSVKRANAPKTAACTEPHTLDPKP